MPASRKPPTPPHPPKGMAEDSEDLPSVDCLGITKVGRGYVLVRMTVKGDKVLDREVISRAPEPRALVARRAQSEVIKNWAMAPKGVSA